MSAGNRTWIYVPLILYEVGGIFYAPLAQMEEHSTFNRVAMGPRSTLRSGPCWTWSTGPQHPIWSMTAWVLNFDNRR